MNLKSLLVRMAFKGVKPLCCLSIALAGTISNAAETTLDGSPVVFDQIVIGNFDDNTNQAWGQAPGGRFGGFFTSLGQLQNNTGTSGGDPYAFIELSNSPLPGVPDDIVIGNLPGQFDIVQFDLRFDSLPAAAITDTTIRGQQFFQSPSAVRVNFLNNDGIGMPEDDVVPQLPTDSQYHTYTIQRFSTDPAWGTERGRVRIDPIDQSTSDGTLLSIDNVSIGRSNNVQAFAAFTAPVNNLIANGGFSDIQNEVLGTNTSAADVNGSNGNFGPFQGSGVDVDNWAHFNEDPNNLIPAVADGGELDLLNATSGNQGSWYLDTHRTTGSERIVTNSAQDYRNGLIQENILDGVTIDPSVDYEFSFDVFSNNRPSNPDAEVKVALTVGTGAAAIDTANAVSGSLYQETLSDVIPAAGGLQQLEVLLTISGADLLAAQNSGQVNVIFSNENAALIPGFPGSVVANDHQNSTVVSQVQWDNFLLTTPLVIPTGDVNKDGVVTQADVDLANLYLAGDGSDTAEVRQNTLIGLGNASADVLASLNLADFDLVADDFFDAADVAAIAALISTTLLGDADGDGDVDGDDLIAVQTNFGSVSSATGDADFDGDVDGDDLIAVQTNFGNTSSSAFASAVPEPTAAMLAALALIGFATKRRS